jgi:tellurite resistance protein TehA-like permease
MRKRTVKSGLRLLTFAISLLLFGTFFGQQINSLFAVSGDGAAEFVKLAFFWGAVFGAAAILMISFGLLQRSIHGENVRLLPSMFILLLLISAFFVLFYRSITSPPQQQPLRPGETLLI